MRKGYNTREKRKKERAREKYCVRGRESEKERQREKRFEKERDK